MSLRERLPSLAALQQSLKPPMEFFDLSKVSRPANMNEVSARISYNTGYFAGNYTLIAGILAIWALVTSPYLLLAIVFLVVGMALIRRLNQESFQVGSYTVTQKQLYTALWVISGILIWLSSPFAILFWLVGASALLIVGHAALMEVGAEAGFQQVPGEQV